MEVVETMGRSGGRWVMAGPLGLGDATSEVYAGEVAINGVASGIGGCLGPRLRYASEQIQQ